MSQILNKTSEILRKMWLENKVAQVVTDPSQGLRKPWLEKEVCAVRIRSTWPQE